MLQADTFIMLNEVFWLKQTLKVLQSLSLSEVLRLWHLFCGFEPTLFCPDPVPPSWIKTLSIYGPLTGSLAAHSGFITLSCSPLNSVCISLSMWVSPPLVWIPSYLTFCFPFLFSCAVCAVLLSLSFQPEQMKTNKTNLASLTTISTDLPCFFTFPPSDSFSFSTASLLWIKVCNHFPSHLLFSSPEDVGLSNDTLISYVCYSVFPILLALYLRIKWSPGLHLRQQVSQRVKLLIEASLLLHHSLAEEGRKRSSHKKCISLHYQNKAKMHGSVKKRKLDDDEELLQTLNTY